MRMMYTDLFVATTEHSWRVWGPSFDLATAHSDLTENSCIHQHVCAREYN